MEELRCKTCTHGVFDPLWGDYKCAVNCCVIYDSEWARNCDDYEKGECKNLEDPVCE